MKDLISPERFRSNAPYPAVTIHDGDQRYALMISDAYAGKGSETTAIAQYRFHRLLLNELPDIYTAYQHIAATEMIHQDLLGNLLKNLGMAPKLCSGTVNQFWSGKFPDYRCKLPDIYEADAQGERNAIAHYSMLAERIKNESMQALFRRIILDEELHLSFLNSLIAEFR